MPDRTLVMATRTGLIGEVEAEPVIVERDPDGSAALLLDDGQMLELDARYAHELGIALLGRGPARVLPIVGEAA